MNVGDLQYPRRDEMADAPKGNWLDRLLGAMNTNTRTTEQTLRHLDVEGNGLGKYVKRKFTHGVELVFPNPFGSARPSGIMVVDCDGQYAATRAPKWRMVSRQGESSIGVTVEYDLRHTEPCLIQRAAADQAITSGAAAATVTFGTTENSRGSVITESAGFYALAEAGSYQITAKVPLSVGNYTQFFASIRRASDGADIGETFDALTWTGATAISRTITATDKFAAGAQVRVLASMVDSGGSGRNITSGANGRRIEIHRLYNDTVPTANVTLLVLGGA